MNKFIVPVIVIVLVAIGAFFITSNGNEEDASSSNTTPSQSSQTAQNTSDTETDEEASDQNSYTKEEVASHASEDDCWTYIRSNVYDITAYIPRHPGGDDILLACGADGTSLFENRTTSEGEQVGSGTAHSSRASDQLADLKIGILEQ